MLTYICKILSTYVRSALRFERYMTSYFKSFVESCHIPMLTCSIPKKIHQIPMSIWKIHDKLCKIPSSRVVISLCWHARSLCLFKRYMPQDIKLIRCNDCIIGSLLQCLLCRIFFVSIVINVTETKCKVYKVICSIMCILRIPAWFYFSSNVVM